MDRRKAGSGQITRVDDKTRKSPWRATVTDELGRQKNRFFKTEKEAKAFLRDLNADEKKLKTLMQKGVTYTAFSETFLEEKQKQGLKPTAYSTLCANVERTRRYVGNLMLRDLDSNAIQSMLYEMAKDGYSESIMAKSKMAVGAVLKMAASKHFLESLPVLDVTIPRSKNQDLAKQTKNNWLRDDEIAAYTAECVRTYVPAKYTKHAGETLMVHPSGYKLLFLLHTGLRVGEALALTWQDYDEFSKTLLVDKNLVYMEGEKITQTPKTESGERVIILNRQALEDLELLRRQFEEQTADIEARRAEAIRQAKKEYAGSEQKSEVRKINETYEKLLREHKYICGSTQFPYGSSLQNSTKQTHDKICKAIGLSHKVTVHGLRHTYVTHYYLKHKNDPDFDLATFSKSIGHSSVRTTMEIYAHLDMTENRFIQRSVEDLKEF